MKRRILFLILVCTSTFAINIAAQDRYKILFLNISPVEIGGKKCQVSDTFNSDEVIEWTDERQVMKVLSLKSQKQSVIAAREFAQGRYKTLSSYFQQPKRLSTRDGAVMPVPQLMNYLADTFYLIDSIEVKTSLKTDDNHFFYAAYQYNGEIINKKLPTAGNGFVIDYSIYTIDGQSICPFETMLSLYYMDAEKGERLLLSDKFLLVPALL